jgi:hypothetical protein
MLVLSARFQGHTKGVDLPFNPIALCTIRGVHCMTSRTDFLAGKARFVLAQYDAHLQHHPGLDYTI